MGLDADNNIGFTGKNRGGEQWNVGCHILVVGIGVDNDVRAQTDGSVQSLPEKPWPTPGSR